MFHIIVLAAGLSRRMGADNKLLLPWGSKTVLETTIDNILAAQMGHLHIVVGHEAKHIKNVLKNYSNRQPLPPLSLPCRQTGITSDLLKGNIADKREYYRLRLWHTKVMSGLEELFPTDFI